PGSFDPLTLGHVNIINRAVGLFDKLVIGIGTNSSKQPMFSIEQRTEWIKEVFKKDARIEVASYEGLTIDFCRKINAHYILRGIRFVSDFEYERAIADMNHSLAPEIESIFLTSAAAHSSISSTLVRDVIRNGGDARQFLPIEVQY
ncbi:MAG: pantetheine-phosphate adenylyltransferase, partial [Chitinophagaceae bacterium]|nr:pantetheine-phosphate adenylyltransferase [Chitinophagaceae bacterium]